MQINMQEQSTYHMHSTMSGCVLRRAIESHYFEHSATVPNLGMRIQVALLVSRHFHIPAALAC